LLSPDSIGTDAEAFEATMAEHLPTTEIPLDELVGLEPDSKMEIEEHKIQTESMAQSILSGKVFAPILVRAYENRYQILEGHHRFHAYKKAGKDTIPCKIVPEENIKIVGSRVA